MDDIHLYTSYITWPKSRPKLSVFITQMLSTLVMSITEARKCCLTLYNLQTNILSHSNMQCFNLHKVKIMFK